MCDPLLFFLPLPSSPYHCFLLCDPSCASHPAAGRLFQAVIFQCLSTVFFKPAYKCSLNAVFKKRTFLECVFFIFIGLSFWRCSQAQCLPQKAPDGTVRLRIGVCACQLLLCRKSQQTCRFYCNRVLASFWAFVSPVALQVKVTGEMRQNNWKLILYLQSRCLPKCLPFLKY